MNGLGSLDNEELLTMGFIREGECWARIIDRPLHNLDTREWQLLYYQKGDYFELHIEGLGTAGRLTFDTDNELDMFYYSITGKHLVKLTISRRIGYGFMHRTIENMI